jgi:mannitol-specific phosphotransferase system IIBC component
MNPQQNNNGTVYGTIGGTLLSVFANLNAGDFLKTVLLAIIGATTSFICSHLLKRFLSWLKSKRK